MTHHEIPAPLATGAPVPAYRIAAYATMSQEILRDAPAFGHLLTETDEKRRQRRAAHDRLMAERAALRERNRREHETLLVQMQNLHPLLRDILNMHACNDDGKCDGCDMDGYECEPPEWPCRTYHQIAVRLGYAFEGRWPTVVMKFVYDEPGVPAEVEAGV